MFSHFFHQRAPAKVPRNAFSPRIWPQNMIPEMEKHQA
jgi:hypothetical protein